jgi:photosystem II stability/assembly factor-like uncharacterized protein
MVVEAPTGCGGIGERAGDSRRKGPSMKIRAAIVVVLVVLGAAAVVAPAGALQPAGAGWFWQSPVPQGRTLNDVAFGDAQNAWAVGGGGTIMHSSDAGVTWQAQSTPTTEPLGSVDFVDATRGWAVGGANWDSDMSDDAFTGVILGTSDGGVTWTRQLQLSNRAVADVAFVNDQLGWAVGSRGLILHTVDGGQTWSSQASGVRRNLMSVVFANADRGYIGGADGTLLATSDGGLTWRQRKAAPFFWVDVSSLAVDGKGTLWAGLGSHTMSGNFPRLARSSNGGRTWRQVGVGHDYDIWHVTASGQHVWATGPLADSNMGAAVGGTSRVIVSVDGGATWTRHIIGSAATLHSVAVGAGGEACAVGSVIVTSADGGVTWYGRSTHATGGGSFDFVSPTEGWVTGAGSSFVAVALFDNGQAANGTVLHTADGVRWAEQLNVPGRALISLDFADASNGWVVGDRGVIRHTTDGGSTWVAQSGASTALLASIAAPSADAAWVLGYDLRSRRAGAVLLHTTDAGATWAKSALPKADVPLAMSWVSPEDGWLFGLTFTKKGLLQTVLRTTDAGRTWSRQRLGTLVGRNAFPLTVDFVDAEHGWLSAMDILRGGTSILSTSDGGATWTRVASPSAFGTDLVASLFFVDAQEGWASGDAIYHTTDGGSTWSRQVTGLEQLVSVAAFDATHAWAGGVGGMLSTTDTAGDNAPPVTLCDVAGGWSRTSVAVHLTAADVGSAGLASTVYRVDGGPWTPGLTPPEFAAPADHSGDGRHILRYHSTDAAGNVEPTQLVRVKIDTVRPVIRVRPSSVGRDGVLRLNVRIDDRSCPSVDTFELVVRTRHGRMVSGGSYEGFRIHTNRWVTFRDTHFMDPIASGVYRVALYADDRAGNRPARVSSGLLIVKPHKSRWSTPAAGAAAARTATRVSRAPSRDGSLREQLSALLRRFGGGRL